MEQIHKSLLLENRMEIKEQIEFSISDVVNYLKSKTIISPDMTSYILCEPPPSKQVYKLLDLLPTRGAAAFQTFYNATCHLQLWTAADILRPEQGPHGLDVCSMVPTRNVCHLQNPPAGRQNQDRQGMNLDRVLNSMNLYGQVLENEWSPNHMYNRSFQIAVHQNQAIYHSRSMCPPMQCKNQELLCLNSPEQMTTGDNPCCDSPEAILTKCQGLISEFKVPVNINDLITLAALEQKAKLDEKKAHDIVTLMASKVKNYIEAKTNEQGGNMTPEEAVNQYISLSQPQNSHSDFRFFQVWGLSTSILEGPNILAFNSDVIRILDFATKEDKFYWEMKSLKKCRTSNDYTYSVILEFQDKPSMVLLSLEYEKINKELNTLHYQRIHRFQF